MDKMIREMEEQDRPCVLEMMRTFYASPAVWTSGSDEIFGRDIDQCIGDSPYLEGYILEGEGQIQGYAMIAKSYSTEFGRPCIWIEDLYVREDCRGQGLGSNFLKFIRQRYSDCLLRLEVEEENQRAIDTYQKCGYTFLPYMEMKNEP